MSVGSTRKGVTQAKFNDEAANFIFGEIFILSGAVGFYHSDWYIFGGMIIGLIVCMFIPVMNILMGVVLSCLWALISATVVSLFQEVEILDLEILDSSNFLSFLGSIFSTPASQVISGILFLSGLGLHLGAIEWTRDVGDGEDRNFS